MLLHNNFNNHNGVIDKNTDRKRQSAQGHDVQRLSHRLQAKKGPNERKRKRQHYRDGRAEAPQEEQDHDRGQAAADKSLVADALNRFSDEDRLVGHNGELETTERRFELFQGSSDFIHDFERVRARLAIDGHIDLGFSIDEDDIRLDGARVLGVADLLQAHGDSILRPEREIVHLGNIVDETITDNLVIVLSDLHISRRDEGVHFP